MQEYGATACGAAPSQISLMRRAAAASVARAGSQPCSTSLIAWRLGTQLDPAVRSGGVEPIDLTVIAVRREVMLPVTDLGAHPLEQRLLLCVRLARNLHPAALFPSHKLKELQICI